VATLHERGVDNAYLYGATDEIAGGLGAFFLLTEAPERYGLPANADSPIQEQVVPATAAAMGAGLVAAAATAVVFLVTRDEGEPFPPVLGAIAVGAAVADLGAELVKRWRR
jgi:formate dehydrogenase iron-sulfur subunit